MNNLKFTFLMMFFIFILNDVKTQDTTQYEVFDVIYLKDNRVPKGQILSYDSQLGGILFKDVFGRVYNFSRDEYKYFREKQSFPIKVKKQKGLFERKSKRISYSLGVNTSYFYGMEKNNTDDLNSRKTTEGLGLGVY